MAHARLALWIYAASEIFPQRIIGQISVALNKSAIQQITGGGPALRAIDGTAPYTAIQFAFAAQVLQINGRDHEVIGRQDFAGFAKTLLNASVKRGAFRFAYTFLGERRQQEITINVHGVESAV